MIFNTGGRSSVVVHPPSNIVHILSEGLSKGLSKELSERVKKGIKKGLRNG